jgi:hypothetical protein
MMNGARNPSGYWPFKWLWYQYDPLWFSYNDVNDIELAVREKDLP